MAPIYGTVCILVNLANSRVYVVETGKLDSVHLVTVPSRLLELVAHGR